MNRREPLFKIALIAATTLAAAVMIFLVRRSEPATQGSGWLPRATWTQ